MAREFVDFQVIKQRVSLQNILDHYSIDWLRPSGNELIGRCPIHQGKGTRSFHLNLTKNLFNCFSCALSWLLPAAAVIFAIERATFARTEREDRS